MVTTFEPASHYIMPERMLPNNLKKTHSITLFQVKLYFMKNKKIKHTSYLGAQCGIYSPCMYIYHIFCVCHNAPFLNILK